MSGYVSAHCRLAQQMPQYADEHQRCRAIESVRLPDGAIVVPGYCACPCHRERSAQ